MMFKSIPEAIIQHSFDNPDKLCLVDDYGSVTYKEYADLILKGITCLFSYGVKRKSKVLVESSQTIKYLAIQASLQLADAVFIPIPANCSNEKIQDFISKVSPDFLILNSKREGLNFVNILYFDSFENSVFNVLPAQVSKYPEPNDVSEILFTTGTTGSEKGIIISYDNNVALAENVIHGAELKSDNIEFILSPFNHSHGLRRYYANMYIGASVVMQNSVVYLTNLFEKMSQFHVNSMDMVPSALSIILKMSGGELGKYSKQLRYIQFGSAPLSEKDKETLRKMLPDTKLLNMYGSTESGISCISDFSRDYKQRSIGKPAKNSNIMIVDDNHRIISSSENNPGLLSCKSRANMIGYYGENASSIKDVMCDGIVYSNDIAYIDEDGDIVLLGRKGDIICVGGYKFSPEDVENLVLKFKGIADCACIPVNDSTKGTTPKLFIQLENQVKEELFDLVGLRCFLSERLESYKIPEFYEFIVKIPRTYKGSLQRNLLK